MIIRIWMRRIIRSRRKRSGYREEVSKGGHGAHKPWEKFPIEDAREQGVVAADTEKDE